MTKAPDSDEVRDLYVAVYGNLTIDEVHERETGFNRWLAGVKAEAWDKGFDAGIDHALFKDFVFNPYSIKSERAQKYIEKTLSEDT